MGIVYKGLQSGVYKGLHWYARIYRHMKFYRGKQGTIGGIQGITGVYKPGFVWEEKVLQRFLLVMQRFRLVYIYHESLAYQENTIDSWDI